MCRDAKTQPQTEGRNRYVRKPHRRPRIPQPAHQRAGRVATNPRRRFNEDNLRELAESFQSQGILAPLLVRELEEQKYEVVAGARRLRAAKLAALDSVPVRVVALTDAQAIEAQVVENLQREDIHPLEEALGFRALLDLNDPAYTLATIAARRRKK